MAIPLIGGAIKAIGGVLSGGFVKDIVKVVDKFVPDKMSQKERADVEMAIMQLNHKKEMEIIQVWNEQEKNFQQFVSKHEGTAADLAQLGILGKILLGLRGLQRPVWGFGILLIDWNVFSGVWTLDEQMLNIVWIVNLVILSFLFGERAIKNVLPLVTSVIQSYKSGNNTTSATG